MNKHFKMIIVTLAILAMSVACGGSANPVPALATLPPVIDEVAINAEGQLVPLRSVDLGFGVAGEVTEVNVAEGDAVESGDVIARLKDDAQRAAVAQAEAGLAVAQANRDRYLQQLPQLIAAAEADVRSAQAQLAAASAQRDQGAALIEAEAALAQAQFAQQQAQTAHDRLVDHEILGAPEEQARLALESAIKTTEAAQARVDALKRGSPSDRAEGAQIAAASAALNAAQARLDQLNAEAAGQPDSTYAAAVEQAEASLFAAQASLAQTELHAPFDATIASLELKLGQRVGQGTTVVVLADLSNWQIETSDLTEIEVPNINVGQQVMISIDALPDLTLTGEVQSIGTLFQIRGGDVIYPVKIRLLDSDPRLRWGMTMAVTFEQ